MKNKFIFTGFLFCAALIACGNVRAEYVDQLKTQVKEIEARYTQGSETGYFRDMGIVARKADDSQNYNLLAEILNSSLFEKMESYVKSQMKEIDAQIEKDPYKASSSIEGLVKTQIVYEPSADFLETAEGKGFVGDMARQRQDSLVALKKNPSVESFIKALAAYQKTGLFSIRNAKTEEDLNNLRKQLGCTVGWKKKISFKNEQIFKTDYEGGTVTEDVNLTLQGGAGNYAAAEWHGPWIYRYKGRDGEGLGTSEAILKVQRGQYETELIITAARLSSTGRFNFPVTLNDVRRLVNIEPPRLFPKAELDDLEFSLTGCDDEGPKIKKVENKNGKVLLG